MKTKKELCFESVKKAINNPFIANAEKIKAICDKDNCDVGVGLDKYITATYGNTKKERENIKTEWIKEYKALCREFTLNSIVDAVKKTHA